MKIRSDFVTNSSSSCFICDTTKTPGEVKFKLQKMLDFYNEMHETYLHFDYVFNEPYVSKGNEEYLNYYTSRDTKGKILIFSASDNTIPYSLFDLIEEIFDADRIHLG